MYVLCPPVRVHSNDADLFPLAGVGKQAAKEEGHMTISKARAQLTQCIRYLHLDDDEFTIRNGRLVSKNGAMDFPVSKLIAIIPDHGTVMAVWPREDGNDE